MFDAASGLAFASLSGSSSDRRVTAAAVAGASNGVADAIRAGEMRRSAEVSSVVEVSCNHQIECRCHPIAIEIGHVVKRYRLHALLQIVANKREIVSVHVSVFFAVTDFARRAAEIEDVWFSESVVAGWKHTDFKPFAQYLSRVPS